MEYRLDKEQLLESLGGWNRYLKKKVHLIACGGTAMTLLGVKASTKDVDFMVPEPQEHAHLIKTLKSLDYKPASGNGWKRDGEMFVYDLFCGKRIHTTELLESPLEPGRHQFLFEWTRMYVGVLNEYDLISSKIFRGTSVDIEDCIMLLRAHRDKIEMKIFLDHYRELASYDISEEKILKNLDYFLSVVKEEGLYD